MSLLFNARRAKCVKTIFPVVKHISTNIKQQAITSLTKRKVPIRYMGPNHKNAATSIIFGFSLIGLIDESETNSDVIDTIERGQLYLQNGDYNAFEQTLHDALDIAYNVNNVDGITRIYDLLANGAFMNKEYEKAKNLFDEVILRLINKGYTKDHLIILRLGLKISKIYEIQKEYGYSEFGYLFCLKRLEEKLKIFPENKNVLDLYAKTLDAYGRFLMNKGEIKLAKVSFKKAYTASVMSNGELFEKNVILLNVLGTLYHAEGNLNEAIFYFRSAKKIGKHLPNMKSLSAVYINLSNAYLRQGMLKKAEKNCEKGMQNAKRHRFFKGKKEAEICLVKINNVMKQRQIGQVGK